MGSIVVKNLGKAYKQYPSRWGRLIEWLLPDQQKPLHTLKWVLQDVSFEIAPGESVGIVGVNGAGKSTLLKMITGTTQPTTGSVSVSGRVAALLELGMGFHPDFTGRQNVIMAGQLQGMSVEEIHALMPEIEAFSGIGDYIDQPVRVYSSGMQVRLAFAVATAKRPEILIVDEALSVGDAAFQRKCFQRIEYFRSSGTSLLFVSHDVETVKKLCDKAIFIRDGGVSAFAAAKEVCDEYEKYLFSGSSAGGGAESRASVNQLLGEARLDPSIVASCEMIYGNGVAVIEAAWLADADGRKVNVVEHGVAIQWCYRVRFHEEVSNPIFAMMVKTLEGIALYGVDTKALRLSSRVYRSGEVAEVSFLLDNRMAPGVYYLNCGVRLDGPEGAVFLSRRIDSAVLKVVSGDFSTAAVGVVDMRAVFSVVNGND